MIAIAVDDEVLMLRALVRAMKNTQSLPLNFTHRAI